MKTADPKRPCHTRAALMPNPQKGALVIGILASTGRVLWRFYRGPPGKDRRSRDIGTVLIKTVTGSKRRLADDPVWPNGAERVDGKSNPMLRPPTKRL